MKRCIIEWEGWSGTMVGELESIPGQDVMISRDEELVRNELKRQGLWSRMAPSIESGSQMLLAKVQENGMHFFAWFDQPKPGGLLWVALPGAKLDSKASVEAREWIMTGLGWAGARVIPVGGQTT